jgi:two-component system, NarL family, response regulator
MKHRAEPNARTIRVVVAEDHGVVRDGLVALIEREADMTVVGQAATGRDAVALVQAQRPDVTLMDLQMPNGDGVEAIRTLRAEFPAVRILVLTTYDGDEDIYRGLQAGAQGYLLKDVPYEELIAAIRLVHAGQKYLPPPLMAKVSERIGGAVLTEREREVVQLLVAGRSNAEIGTALYITEGTAKFHVTNILAKLGVQDRTQAVVVALKRGLARIDHEP